MRAGIGYDIHRLVKGRRLMLGGVEIDFKKGLLGHSDADVLLHALCDALLGAAAMGDIGRHFPDSDPVWKDAPGLVLLDKTWSMVSEKFAYVSNIDATVFAQEPRLWPYIDDMEDAVCRCLAIDKERINIKATTTEGLGAVGSSSAIAAMCVVLLE